MRNALVNSLLLRGKSAHHPLELASASPQGDTPKRDDLLQRSWASFRSLKSPPLPVQPYQLDAAELTPPCARPIVAQKSLAAPAINDLCPRVHLPQAAQAAILSSAPHRPRMPS